MRLSQSEKVELSRRWPNAVLVWVGNLVAGLRTAGEQTTVGVLPCVRLAGTVPAIRTL